MKKTVVILLMTFMLLGLSGCSEKEVSVVRTYEVTDSSKADFNADELITLVEYYEMSDGTWKTDEHTYRYRLEITGRMPNAVKDTTYVFFEQYRRYFISKSYDGKRPQQ